MCCTTAFMVAAVATGTWLVVWTLLLYWQHPNHSFWLLVLTLLPHHFPYCLMLSLLSPLTLYIVAVQTNDLIVLLYTPLLHLVNHSHQMLFSFWRASSSLSPFFPTFLLPSLPFFPASLSSSFLHFLHPPRFFQLPSLFLPHSFFISVCMYVCYSGLNPGIHECHTLLLRDPISKE